MDEQKRKRKYAPRPTRRAHDLIFTACKKGQKVQAVNDKTQELVVIFDGICMIDGWGRRMLLVDKDYKKVVNRFYTLKKCFGFNRIEIFDK